MNLLIVNIERFFHLGEFPFVKGFFLKSFGGGLHAEGQKRRVYFLSSFRPLSLYNLTTNLKLVGSLNSYFVYHETPIAPSPKCVPITGPK